MKTTKFFAVALAALTMFSCQKENTKIPGGGEGEVGVGVPTTATIFLHQTTAPVGRATEAPVEGEGNINKAIIYIFGKTSHVLEQAVVFEAADITAKKKTFTSTAGEKLIYVAVNYPDAMKTKFPVGTTITAVEKEIVTIAAIADASTNAADKGFWMTNSEKAASVNLKPGITAANAPTENNVTVSVGRTTAKLSLAMAAGYIVEDKGTFTFTGYKMKLMPKSGYFMPVTNAAGKRITPNYDVIDTLSTNFLNGTAFATTNNYITENIHAIPRKGNTTCAVVTGTYVPLQSYDENGANEKNGAAPNGDYWRVVRADGTFTAKYYYKRPLDNHAIAEGGVGAKQTDVYTRGAAFYRIAIADNSKTNISERNCILRNNFYKVSITKVTDGGWNTEDGTKPGKPEDPIETETNMQATIEILPWNVIEQSGGI